MAHQGSGQAWGKLVKVDASPGSEILLINRECTVGRKKDCDLSFPANKLVSGNHCKITQDQLSGKVWLEDMSTNGTVINMSKVVKKQMHLLQNGDVIYFVYRKNEPEQNIAYVYQAIRPQESASQDVEDAGREEDSDLTETESEPAPVEPVIVKPLPQSGHEDPQPSTSSSSFHFYNMPLSTCSADVSAKKNLVSSSVVHKAESEMTAPAGSPGEPVMNHTCLKWTYWTEGGQQTEPEVEIQRKRRKIDRDDQNGFGSSLSDSAVSAAAPQVSIRGAAGKEKTDGATTDKMEESLTCIVCQDLLHDCVSLQPCMHTFCAACYSGWMERSSFCPTCRCPVERIRKNHILNNLVEAYLLQHPEKCRSEDDLRSMDARNKITQDMLQPKVERSFSDEEGSSDYLFELSDNDSDISDLSQPYMMCRQCPGYRKELSSALWICEPAQSEGPAKVPGDGPSTSSDTSTAPQEFRCPPQGSHLICTCCLQPMPDRRFEYLPPQVSPQHCMVCQKPFCHVYWGCQRIGCHGCLSRFIELNLNDKCLDGVFNGNQYESEVLQNYLTSRGMSWRHMLQESLQAVQQGLYHLSDYRITANSFLCYCCGLRTFRELAYKYRERIPPSELPDAVTTRPDCYWGRNCRTQVKAHHALKFNHVCEQTRFKN
ncbi:E3 ubiquitin-protein ligase CHFR isoform X1 [Megalobrama amblycephala]|uniref:E3 ubiquitin-protein ligase CHFR isoform X1 n=1 Tax=Megalobrama amblycephala TaxID=75352 RepID=UPI002014270A|nr:E3 ubiquitin-protein ligase CHFR isoform X1 [Megalobrama amblycephala]XP_048044636.1 E3 ubiquitin-protein ligase CHFR isoform X1 [Megalobrama amblycephala]